MKLIKIIWPFSALIFYLILGLSSLNIFLCYLYMGIYILVYFIMSNVGTDNIDTWNFIKNFAFWPVFLTDSLTDSLSELFKTIKFKLKESS